MINKYGDDWFAECMKNKKIDLIKMIRRVAIERDELEVRLKQCSSPTEPPNKGENNASIKIY